MLLERGESLQGACRQIRDATAVKDKLVNAAFENPSKLWCFAKLAAKYG